MVTTSNAAAVARTSGLTYSRTFARGGATNATAGKRGLKRAAMSAEFAGGARAFRIRACKRFLSPLHWLSEIVNSMSDSASITSLDSAQNSEQLEHINSTC